MNVAFSVGEKSKVITNTLKKSADNVDFYSYSTIQDMIKESLARHIPFNRVVFSTQILSKVDPESDLRELNDFIKNYSNSTEIVMIMTTKDTSGIDKVFTGMFNSPLYTPIILDRATAQNLLQVVNDDIAKLKTQYYVLDVRQDRTIVSGSPEGGVNHEGKPEVKAAPPEPEKKRGLFGIFRGGKSKTSAQNPDPVPPTGSVSQEPTVVPNSVPENDESFSSGPATVFGGFGGENGVNPSMGENEAEKKFEGFGNVRPISEPENLPLDFYGSGNSEDDLSIGDYGEQHTDTGFLDDGDEEELKRLMAEPEEVGSTSNTEPAEGTEVETGEGSNGGFREEPSRVETGGMESGKSWNNGARPVRECQEREKPVSEESRREVRKEPVREVQRVVRSAGKPNLDMVIGVKGSGCTQSIVDEAVSLVQDEGIKVLIIDLDTRENGLLSYIDTEKFYTEGAYMGIDKLRVYEEEGVGVVSNGYGVPVSTKSLLALLNSRVLDGYGMVFLDCPAECLEVVSSEVIRKCNLLVMSGVDRSDLLATSMALTDRENVEFDVEKYIMDNCLIEFKNDEECPKEDLDWVRRVCLFANGCWLDRVGL